MIGSTARITALSRPASDPTIQKRNSSSVRVEDQHRARERDEQRGQDRARRRQPDRVRPVAARAEHEDDDRRRPGAHQGERGVAGGGPDPEERDGDHDRERGARVDAERRRLGERVARRSLHQRARGAERGTDEQPELRPRHAQSRTMACASLPS
jgi:hypothetical protein